jgi:hypothetical protein
VADTDSAVSYTESDLDVQFGIPAKGWSSARKIRASGVDSWQANGTFLR